MVYCYDREFVLADLPGLIANAHLGVGLGHRFLGHVERCSVLLHLIDATQEDVVSAYKTIREELYQYHEGLATKPEVLALNKCDALTQEEIDEKITALKKAGAEKVYTISAVAKQGINEVLGDLLKFIDLKKEEEEYKSVDKPTTTE